MAETETHPADHDGPQWEFAVTEHFTTSHTYYVTAATRQAAVDKVLAHEYDDVVQGDVYPRRPIKVRDARRGRRVISPASGA